MIFHQGAFVFTNVKAAVRTDEDPQRGELSCNNCARNLQVKASGVAGLKDFRFQSNNARFKCINWFIWIFAHHTGQTEGLLQQAKVDNNQNSIAVLYFI